MRTRGAALAHAAFGLEYQDLVIPLTVSVLHWRHPDPVSATTPRVQPIIRAYLKEAAGNGWRPDEPTDFPTLFSRSRVRTRTTFLRWRIDSRAIRLTRITHREQVVPHG